MGAEDVLSPHLVEGQRGSNLGEDVVLVPLGMLRKYVLLVVGMALNLGES